MSVAVAETALLPAVRAAGPETVILADGFSCRTQLEQLSDRRGIHLVELLAAHLGSARGSVPATVPAHQAGDVPYPSDLQEDSVNGPTQRTSTP